MTADSLSTEIFHLSASLTHRAHTHTQREYPVTEPTRTASCRIKNGVKSKQYIGMSEVTNKKHMHRKREAADVLEYLSLSQLDYGLSRDHQTCPHTFRRDFRPRQHPRRRCILQAAQQCCCDGALNDLRPKGETDQRGSGRSGRKAVGHQTRPSTRVTRCKNIT